MPRLISLGASMGCRLEVFEEYWLARRGKQNRLSGIKLAATLSSYRVKRVANLMFPIPRTALNNGNLLISTLDYALIDLLTMIGS
jgi:hypothetical protein